MRESSDMSNELGDSSSAMALTGKIMVIAVIILFIAVIFVLLLHLYAKWFWRRVEEPSPNPPNPRRRRRRFVFAPGQDTAVALRKGLDPTVLRSIPVVVFSPEEFKDGLECAVCLSELAQGEKARLLPKCNHGFHVDCIDMWFQSHCTCPLCRNPVDGGMCSKSVDSIDLEEEIENDAISTAIGGNGNGSGSGSIGGSTSSQPMEEGLSGVGVNSTESLSFPTNVLFWGNETQVSSRSASVAISTNVNDNVCSEENGSPSSSSMSIGGNRPDGMVVIDMPRQMADNAGSSTRSSEEEMKAPVTTRLRSLKRLLSRDRRVNPSCSLDSVDIELAGRVQPC